MRYLTLFPEAENVHLIKDVGMIPYSLHRHEGYTATLACYRNGDYPYAQTETPGLDLAFIRKRWGSFADGLVFISGHSKNYDVLQTFHFRLRSLIWLFLFKLLRPSGKTYLKLDANEKVLTYSLRGIKGKLKMYLLRKIDLVSVESTFLQSRLRELWKREVAYIPNGYSNEGLPLVPYAEKQKTVLTVGRIGAPEKRNEVLMEAFASFSTRFPDWELKMLGPVEPGFGSFLDGYFTQYPHLRNKVIFTGAIQDRELLFKEYARASIFCLSSLWESFGIALVEAASAGCYLISSATLAAPDITDREQFGSIFPVDDVPALVQKLEQAAGNEERLKENCPRIQEYARSAFSWERIAKELDQLLNRTVQD